MMLRMLVPVAAAMIAAPVAATMVVDHTIGPSTYAGAWCSTCGTAGYESWARFTLAQSATINVAHFQVLFDEFAPPGTLSVAIYKKNATGQNFNTTAVFSTSVSFASLTATALGDTPQNGTLYDLAVPLSSFSLTAGSYVLGLQGLGDGSLYWANAAGGTDYLTQAVGNPNASKFALPGYTNGYSLENVAAAVPEPAMLGLFGLGAVGLLATRRRA